MISWMTMAILSPVRRSTSGRAPWFRAIIRFWIRVDSLNRPPTLLTIFSSFSSSSIGLRPSTAEAGQQGDQGLDGLLQIAIHQERLINSRGLLGFPAGLLQPTADGRLVVAAPAAEAGFQ